MSLLSACMQHTRQITSAVIITSRTNTQATPVDAINTHVGSEEGEEEGEEEGRGKREEEGKGKLDMVDLHAFL